MKSGFTLLEIMIVVVILGLLGTVIITQVTSQSDTAKVEITKNKLKQLMNQASLFKANFSKLPKSLDDLMHPPKGDPYIGEDQLIDAWNNQIQFITPGPGGKPFDIISYGEDNQAGGDGYAADLSCWDVKKRDE